MFEAALKAKIQRIFDLKKVTFNEPSESMEQECAFIRIQTCKSNIKDGLQVSDVRGTIVVYANGDKLPFSYFQKKIQEADPDDTKDLFFFDIEANAQVMQNIVERSMSFVYFFSGQYDPNLGTITSVTISEE